MLSVYVCDPRPEVMLRGLSAVWERTKKTCSADHVFNSWGCKWPTIITPHQAHRLFIWLFWWFISIHQSNFYKNDLLWSQTLKSEDDEVGGLGQQPWGHKQINTQGTLETPTHLKLLKFHWTVSEIPQNPSGQRSRAGISPTILTVWGHSETFWAVQQ